MHFNALCVMVSRIIMSAVLLVALVGAAGVASAAPPANAASGEAPGQGGESPACETPTTGFETSAIASGGESLQPGDAEINPGVINALEQNDCEERIELLKGFAFAQQ